MNADDPQRVHAPTAPNNPGTGPSTWSDLAALSADDIAYVQFTDAADPGPRDPYDETMNRRPLPGRGTADVRRFADLVRGNGFDGHVSIEVLNEELRSRPVVEVVDALFESTARYWT